MYILISMYIIGSFAPDSQTNIYYFCGIFQNESYESPRYEMPMMSQRYHNMNQQVIDLLPASYDPQ